MPCDLWACDRKVGTPFFQAFRAGCRMSVCVCVVSRDICVSLCYLVGALGSVWLTGLCFSRAGAGGVRMVLRAAPAIVIELASVPRTLLRQFSCATSVCGFRCGARAVGWRRCFGCALSLWHVPPVGGVRPSSPAWVRPSGMTLALGISAKVTRNAKLRVVVGATAPRRLHSGCGHNRS